MRNAAVNRHDRPPDRAAWPEDFEAFYRDRYPWAVRVAHLVVGRADMAHDIAQDALVAVARHWSSVEMPVAYTRRSIVNAAVRARHRGRKERDYVEAQRPAMVPPPELVEPLAALDRLSSRRRAVVVMRFYEDLADQEIAEILGCSKGTVRSLAHRALRQIEKELS